VNKTKNKYNSKHDNGDGGSGGDDGGGVSDRIFIFVMVFMLGKLNTLQCNCALF